MDLNLPQVGMGGLSSIAQGNPLQKATPWPGLALALLVSIGLVIAFFLVQNLARAWIRSRIGFRDTESITTVTSDMKDRS